MYCQGKRISNWFRIVSLDILILKKQQFSKLQKTDQSYPVGAIKVTPNLWSKLVIFKIWTSKYFAFFIHAYPNIYIFRPKKDPKEMTVYLFIYDNYINFIHTWDNLIDRSKLSQVLTLCSSHVTYAFRVNPHSIVAWMSRNSLLEAGAKSKV